MKRRLRNLLMAGIAILGSWSYTSAYTVDDLTSAGWTKVESITDVSNNLFIFVDAGSSNYAMANATNNGRPFYQTLADPTSNPSQTWILEGSGDTYALKNAHSKFYFNSGDAGWNNYIGQSNDNANYQFALADGKYSLTSTKTSSLVGPWNNNGAVANDGENVAANKSPSQAPGFYIYCMTFADYASKRAETLTAATKENPIEVTSYIFNPDFASNSNYGWTQTGGYGNRQYGSGTMEAWNINNANISQQITGLPNGVYKVTADVISGPGVPLNAYVYASAGNEVKSGAVTAVASAGNYGTMSNEVAGKTLEAENVNVVNGTMTIGVKDPSTGNGWIVLDNFKLYYYGVDLSALEEALQEKITEAQAIDQTKLNDGFKTILNDAITAAQNAEYTEEDLTAQTIALGNTITLVNNAIIAITETNNLIAIYQGYATNSTAPDKSAFNTAISTAETNLANATTIDAIKAVEEDLQEALLAYLDSGASPTEGYPFDLTFKVINPEFATDLSGWTGTGTQRWYPDAVGFDGNGFVEYCNWGGAWEGAVSQTISGLPNGTYIIKAAYQASASELTMTLTANDIATNLVCIGNTGGNIAQGGEIVAAGNGYQGWQYGEVQCKVTDGTLTIKGSSAATVKERWANFDHVIVSYVSALDLSEIVAAYETALADAQATAAKTNDAEASLKTALETAITTYGDVNRTNQALMEEATAALSATTTNVNNSISAYASAKAYLDKMGAVLDNTNVYTQDAYDAKYGTWLAEYNAGTLATSTAATLNANLAYSTDWHSANNIDEVLLSSWTIGGEKPTNYDKALYINTWSTEGATDGSEFLAPFFEYWTNDEQSLGANTIQAAITGLNPSTTYSFTIRARVRQTNNQTKIANGITMQVGSGETVDISSGTIFGTGPFFIGNFSAVGETDAEGTLTATITVAANSNISWLSFYNAKYTEGEDLSAYIADYEFALANATAYLSKGMNPNLLASLQSTVDTYSSVDTTNKAALITAKEALDAALTDEIRASVAELEGSSINGWSRTGNSANFEVNTWSGEGATDGSNMTTPFLQNWQGKENGALGDAVMTYTLTDQAQGYYRVSALIRSLNENGGAAPAGTFIFANTAIERAYDGTVCTNGVYDEPEVYGYVGADGNLSIGVKVIRANVNWVSFKNFKVEYVGTELTNDMVSNLTEEAPSFTYNTTAQATLDAAVSALSGTQNADNYVAAGSAIETAYRTRDVDFTELNTAIANAEAAASGKVLGFATGEYAPYNNVEVITALATAKAIDQATATDQIVIINATNALNAASWNENTEEVNAIYDGSFEYAYSTDGNVKPFGWHATNDRDNATNVRYMWDVASNAGLNATSTGKALFTKYEAYYGQETGYTMPLKANTVYELTFVYGGWSDCKKDGYVTVTDPNGDNIEVTVSRLPLDATNGHQDATAWKNYKARFQTSDAGNYVLGLRKDNDGTTVQSQYVYGDMKLFTAKAEDINFTFKADYGTLILPFDAELQEGMEAYTCDGKEENELTLTLTPAESFVANTPYIVKKTGATTDYTFNGIAYSTATTYTDGLLTGTLVDMTAPAGSLVLQNQPSGLGFYQVDTNDITVKANRVYVTEEVAGVNVRALILPGNETGINSVVAEDSIVDVYTIGGVKVKEGVKASEALNGLAKGFYIVGGKKVMK